MYTGNPSDPLLAAAYIAIELLKPIFVILIILAILVVIARVLLDVFAVDGGHGRREQRQRHRLQFLILLMAVSCGATGVFMTFGGYGEGHITIRLPGGGKIENGGMAAVFTSAMLFIIWFLMKMVIATKEKEQVHEPTKFQTNAPHGSAQWPVARGVPSVGSRFLDNVTYAKAAVITVILFVPLGPIALLPGGYLAFRAWQQRQHLRILIPPEEE